jgi:ornithine cyclodeaminase/alanine dehydrogenase-like protein (mu-crystallin family)
MTLLLSNRDVAQASTMREVVEHLEQSFKDQALGRTVDRPRSHANTPLAGDTLGDRFYEFKSMDGSVQRLRVHALRLNSNVIVQDTSGGNRRWEVEAAAPGGTMCGLLLLFSIDTGELLAIMKDRHLQEMRVGATSALAAKAMARSGSHVVGLFGTGGLAGPQVQGLAACLDLTRIKVYSPNEDHRTRFVERMRKQLQIEVVAAREPREVVAGSDIVACATNSFQPVFDGRWLEPGQHVNSVQAWELDRISFERARYVVVRSMVQSVYAHMGDEGTWQEPIREDIRELVQPKLCTLGEALLAKVRRGSEREITLHGGTGSGGSSGLGGTQFAAIGHLIYQKAVKLGLGRELPSEWFLQKQARDVLYPERE